MILIFHSVVEKAMLLTIYQSTRRHIPEESNLQVGKTERFITVNIQNAVFWIVTQCGLLDAYRSF